LPLGLRLGKILVVRTYAIVCADAPDEAIELFVRREDADAFLADCLKDEPGWVETLSMVPVEADGRNVSAN
jgi:hypothetical protein